MRIVVCFMLSSWIICAWLESIFEVGKPGANITSFSDALWWGIVTILTVGYGDRYPVSVEGRLIGSVLMCSGVVAMAIITAKISSILLQQALLEGRGIVDKDKLNNHFVVCGWKEDMSDLLEHILEFNHDLSSDQMVLIANIHQSAIDDLRANEKLKNLKVLVGNAFQHSTLERAAPAKARKVLVLADRSPDDTGKIPNEAEADARTIMTVITLSNIARGTLVTAEILDPKMDHYLEIAGVSDIIYSREYSRLLLGNASSDTGLSNIIHDLLDPNTPAFLCTEAIAEEFHGRKFHDFKQSFEGSDGHGLVVGILENTGNPQRIKEKAIRDAQKTANVQNMIKNLQSVKHMRCNNPVFLPADDYVIGAGAAAIVVKNRVASSKGKTANRVA